MKSALKMTALLAVLTLAGCVYGPDYGYVRGDGYYGDAYYGTGYSYDGYYDYYGPGCCYYGYGYPSISLGFFHDNFRHGGWRGGRGGWSGRGSANNRSRSPSMRGGARSRGSAPSRDHR